MTSRPHYHSSICIAGFSLVELMVGMVIALIASLAIVQVFSTFEDQKRSTTAGSEAQENGLIALSELEQSIHNAGAGLINAATFDCATATTYTYLDSAGGGSGGANPLFSLVPLSITDGGTTGSDTITVRIGNNLIGAVPTTISKDMPQESSEFYVNNPGVFKAGDLDIVMSGGNCTVQNVTTVQMAAGKIQHNPGNSGPNNPPANVQHAQHWPGYLTGSTALSIGVITANTYSVSNNKLQLASTNINTNISAPAVALSKDIVSLQAQYGVAAATPAGAQNVSSWVNATGSWAAPSNADVKRIKAVRIVLVARSGKKELTNVTSTCPNNAGTNNGPCAWQDSATDHAPLIDLSSDPDWQKYRYKVYQTVIPLRNVIWANV
jgi:type IV pilus assembly protein PilW